MSEGNKNGLTVGFCGLLTIVLLVLKLTVVEELSWWVVVAPILVPIALSLIFLLIVWIIWLTGKRNRAE